MQHDCPTNGAAMAFYTIFSLPPLLVIVLMLTSSLGFTKQEVDRIIHQELGFPATDAVKDVNSGFAPASQHRDIESHTANSEEATSADTSSEPSPQSSARKPASLLDKRLIPFSPGNLTLISKLLGIGILVFSASGSFGQLQLTLNRIWAVEPDPDKSWVAAFLVKRFLTAIMVVVIGCVFLVSLVLTTMIDPILEWIIGNIPGSNEQILGIVLNEGVSLAVAVLLFGAMFKILPDVKLRWSDVWVGATVTAVLFVAGKVLIGWYLRTSNVGADWGASAASSVAALVWVYYSSLIVLFGAELTHSWATRHGKSFAPTHGAIQIIEEKHLVRN